MRYAKAGIMFRENDDKGGEYVSVLATAAAGVEMEWRDETGKTSTLHGGYSCEPSEAHPVWVKLVKSGVTYTGYCSQDGVVWDLIEFTHVAFNNSVFSAGLAVTAHDNWQISTAMFSNVDLRSPAQQELLDTRNVRINLARNAIVTVSSADGAHPGQEAVDGRHPTNWEPSKDGPGEWLCLDFGEPRSLTGAAVLWHAPATAYPYKIEVSSDAAQWKLAAENKDGRRDLTYHDFTATARYVRLTYLNLIWQGVRK